VRPRRVQQHLADAEAAAERVGVGAARPRSTPLEERRQQREERRARGLYRRSVRLLGCDLRREVVGADVVEQLRLQRACEGLT